MDSHYAPKATLKAEAYTTDLHKYEGVKAKIDGQLMLVGVCLNKCNANFKTGVGLGENGDVCMTKCYNKYLDSSLLIHKETTKYSKAMIVL